MTDYNLHVFIRSFVSYKNRGRKIHADYITKEMRAVSLSAKFNYLANKSGRPYEIRFRMFGMQSNWAGSPEGIYNVHLPNFLVMRA